MIAALLRACADWLEHRHQIRLFPVRERACWSRWVSSELLPINFLTIHCFRVITGDDPAVSTDQTGSPSPRSPFATLSWLQLSLNGEGSSGCSAAATIASPSIREAAIPRDCCGGQASPCTWPRPRPSGFREFVVTFARATFARRTLQVRRGGHYICTERATLDPTTRVTATGPEDWFFEAVQRIGGTCNCYAGPLAFDLHLIPPIAAAGAEILLIACYRVVSAVRKSVTVVARQTSVVLDRQSEHIADAAFGLDDPRPT
jgi:hypothetical protein